MGGGAIYQNNGTLIPLIIYIHLIVLLVMVVEFLLISWKYTINNSDFNDNKVTNPKQISQNEILAASKKIKTYGDKNKKLPDSVTIKNVKYSIEEYKYLSSKTLKYRYLNKKNSLAGKYNIKSPIILLVLKFQGR